MSSSTRAPAQSRLQRSWDAAVRSTLRTRLHRIFSGKLLIITVVGRKTGREYANPVGYATHEGDLLVGTAARWRRNLRDGEPVRVTLRGKEIDADWEVITDEEQLVELYRIILEQNPVHGRFAGISLDADGSVNRTELRTALGKGTAVVRLHPRDESR
ncbi:nitroreductase/quinone reductase family protein [Nocardia miyunensis]|uniref:nitroreductase/quinone reductase family protein n=1 Tax=Nocardia miyunensis TaxID=282684 RepID=UPI000A01070F|nr:nitroreductase/quinone reductase family protein [Nocardia miyunensis]